MLIYFNLKVRNTKKEEQKIQAEEMEKLQKQATVGIGARKTLIIFMLKPTFFSSFDETFYALLFNQVMNMKS